MSKVAIQDGISPVWQTNTTGVGREGVSGPCRKWGRPVSPRDLHFPLVTSPGYAYTHCFSCARLSVSIISINTLNIDDVNRNVPTHVHAHTHTLLNE